MSARFRHAVCLGLILGNSSLLAGRIHAQVPPVPTRVVSPAGEKVPPMPQLKSPVEQFRQLLALAPSERENHLTNRPPEIRKRILAKLLEYDAMKPADRELLLRNTQLQWYLLTFIQSPAGERASQLAMVSEGDRPVIKAHLEAWDKLSSEDQKEVLKYETVLELVLRQGNTNMAVPPLPSAPNSDNIKNLNAFLSLPQEKRQQMYDSFQKFFELGESERLATVDALPVRERMQMNFALKNFDRLPKPQRERCIRSFAKFSSMSEAERQEFFKNAERWRELSPAERQAWRDLVNQTPPLPPIPNGVVFPPPPPHVRLVQEASDATAH